MSTYYLIDPHTLAVTASPIIDVAESSVVGPNPSTPMNGGFIVRVPDTIAVRDPASVPDLLTKKHLGLLPYFAGYTYVTYDDFLDATGVDFAAPGLKGSFGERNSIKLPPFLAGSGGLFQSSVVTLSGPAPTQVVVTWEAYRVDLTDLATDRSTLTYVEMPASDLVCNVTFDGGANFYTMTDGAIFPIPPAGQGTSFAIRLENPSTTEHLFVGSWSVVY